jgi:hypothetical protein
MELADAENDRESEPAAWRLFCLQAPFESSKHFGSLIFGDSGPGVGDDDLVEQAAIAHEALIIVSPKTETEGQLKQY